MANRRLYSDLDLNGLRVTNVGTPTVDGDVTPKVYVDRQLRDAVDAAVSDLTAAFEAADAAARTAEDANNTAIRDAFAAADDAVRRDFAAADAALRTEFQGADQDIYTTLRGELAAGDTAVRGEFAAADADLERRIRADFDTAGQGTAETLRREFAAADDAVRGEFAAADAAVRNDFAAADSAIRTEFAAADTAERDARIAADSDLTNRLQRLDADLNAADAALRTDIANEATARADADTAIRGEVAAADAAIRGEFAAADTALGGRIDAESTARTDADNAIRGEFAAADTANLNTVRGELAAAEENLRAYTESSIAALTNGQVLKGAVRVAVDEDIDPAAPPAVIQGETLAEGDTILLTAQTPGSENGPYTLTGGTLVRAANWDTPARAVVGSYWVVRAGTYADQFALLTNDEFTLDTTAAEFLFIEAVRADIPAFVEAVPAVAAGAEATLTHNFGTMETTVSVVETASGQDVTGFIAFRKTAASVVLMPDVALAPGELTVYVGRLRG